MMSLLHIGKCIMFSIIGGEGGNMAFQKQVEHAITDAIASLGLDVFKKSQEKVPTQTGTLKQSGSHRPLSVGFEITYTAPHAQQVEFGTSADSQAGVHVSQIPPHIRRKKTGVLSRFRGKGNKYIVKAHTKTYTNAKPMLMPDGSWKTITFNQGGQGSHFLGNSLEEVLGDFLTKTDGLSGKMTLRKIQG